MIQRMQNESSWREKITPTTYFPSLNGHHSFDVVIIGGGMAGILTAYQLARSGKKIALLEKGMIGGGATEYTTAFLTQSIDTSAEDMIAMYGIENSKTIIESHKVAIDTIEKIITDEKIECEFKRCSNIIYANDTGEYEDLEKEFEEMKKIGYDCELHDLKKELGFMHAGFIEVKNQAKFHPLKFLYALADKTSRMGVKIYENTEAKDFVVLDGRDPIIVTSGGEIISKQVIVTTYTPFEAPLSLYFKKGMYVSYVLELEISKGIVTEGTYEDMKNPYHYFRIDSGEEFDRVIVGGEDHRKDIRVSPAKNFKALEEFARKTFGDVYTIKRRWNGPILEPVDGLPLIGSLKDSEVISYATAFSGNGMTYSAISSIILSDKVLGKEHPWLSVYNAQRSLSIKSLAIKGKDYAEEFFQGAVKNTFSKKSDSVRKEE